MGRKDIRKQVLRFAKNSMGKRVWARTRSFNETNGVRYFQPLVNTYNWKGVTHSCIGDRAEQNRWSRATVIYSDNSRENDFKGRDEAKRKNCFYGAGECWDLAYAALQKNGGLWNSTYTGEERKWSDKLIKNLNEIKGGEIIEISATIFFLKFSFKQQQDKITSINTSSNQIGPNISHTAIIKKQNSTKGLVSVYEQNTIDESGIRNLSVHEGKYFLLNKKFSENNLKILQICGGSSVERFIEQSNQIIRIITKPNFLTPSIQNKLKKLIRDMESYVQSNTKIPEKIKIYIPYGKQ